MYSNYRYSCSDVVEARGGVIGGMVVGGYIIYMVSYVML